MATNLKKTNVVVVGLGAAGGTAVLPLTRAGLDVIGLEAGDWLAPRDFAPDELRNNVRGWPQSVQKANTRSAHAPARCEVTVLSTTRVSPDDERGGRHARCISSRKPGVSARGISKSSARLFGGTARRAFRRVARSKTGRSATRSSSRTTTRSTTRSAYRARRATSSRRSIPAAIYSRARAVVNTRCRRCA